jgi:hypothetical protein
LADLALQSGKNRIGNVEDDITNLTSDDGSSTKKSIFGSSLGIGIGAAG